MSISEDNEDSSHAKLKANSDTAKVKEKPSKAIITLPNKKEKSKNKTKDQNSEMSDSNLSLKSKKDEIVSNRTPRNDRKKSESEFKVSSKYSKASSDYLLSSKLNDSKVETQINLTNSGVEVGVVFRNPGEKKGHGESNNSRPHSIHSVV